MSGLERAAKRERWRAEIEAWRASGQTLSAWARERNISRDVLEYWKRRIPISGPPARTRTLLTLIPVRPGHMEQPASPIELIGDAWPGLRIRLAADFDAGSLDRLLELLEARC